MQIREGELVAVIGPNASGKSTLLKLLAGIIKPDRGTVQLQGINTRNLPPSEMGRNIGYLSQNPNDYLTRDTVEDELKFTLENFNLPDNGIGIKILQRQA